MFRVETLDEEKSLVLRIAINKFQARPTRQRERGREQRFLISPVTKREMLDELFGFGKDRGGKH